jgi:glycogen debranching enzyme
VNARKHRRREQILAQHQPTTVRRTADAVVLKQGSLFLLATEGGDVPWTLPHGFGLFYQDCRYLDGYTLRLNGQQPTALSVDAGRGYETRHDLVAPELPGPDGAEPVENNTVAVRRRRLIRGGVMHDMVTLHNYGRAPARLDVELCFRAKFEDIFILKGFVKGPRGRAMPPRVVDDATVELCYEGRDGADRVTTLVFWPRPDHLTGQRAVYSWTLEPGAEHAFAVSVAPAEHPRDKHRLPTTRAGAHPARLRQHLQKAEDIWLEGAAEVRSSNHLFDQVLRRSLLDLRLLRSKLDGKSYFAAGVPWFVTLFGRDAATVCIQTMPYGQSIARDTLRLLARYQAKRVDPYRDAAPGKILHEFRTGELADLGAIPQAPAYYGSVDATPLFVILLGDYVNWSGNLDLARRLRPNLEAALGWIERYADHDDDGYVDYVGRYPTGLINQGWKDAGNSILHADGSMPEPPLALCEVQAYVFRAWTQAAALLDALGDRAAAADLRGRAAALRERFERDFWSEDLGCYRLARAAGGRPVEVASSNSGQVLWGGIASPGRAARVAERLMAPDLFSGWGVRTLSSEAGGYNPVSYHLGSVWPHDNGLIAAGLRRYGQDAPALRIFATLFEAAAGFTGFRLPELFAGYARQGGESHPVRYPVACSPQAWAAGALPHVLWTLLGLRADALAGRLRVVRPVLPEWLDWVELVGVPIGPARVDLRFDRRRADGRVQVDARVRQGDLTVEHLPELLPPDAF